MHRVVDAEGVAVDRVVLPKGRRRLVLEVAHDKCSHIGIKKMKETINKLFTWPGMGVEIADYVKSCDVCCRVNKQGNKGVCIQERPLVDEPFASVAIDLVGPLPKGRQGVQYLLTYNCMATRWPEAVPLRTVTATEVAEALVSILCRTGIPQRILTDQGSVFTGRLMKDVCEVLGCEHITTSPYRPQGNGVVERFHGTLKPMLAKAKDQGVDWSRFLPLALFAIRQVPNRDTGFSPHQLAFGRKLRGPLDLIYAGWVKDGYERMDVHGWVNRLQDRLKVLHDCAMANGALEMRKRLDKVNSHRMDRELSEGSFVLLRVPGLVSNLEASWEGPYEVVKRLNKVKYRVRRKGSSGQGKVVHISNTKVYIPRESVVLQVSVAVEDDVVRSVCDKSNRLSEEFRDGYSEIELQDVVSRNEEFFSELPGLCSEGECKIGVNKGSSVVNLPVRKLPYKLKEKVECEIEKMLEIGVIEV